MAKRRALGVVRLSKLTEETTSPARQREIIERKAAERGVVIVGWAQDDDISATVYAPMDRPELRKWLDRPGEYDEIIFWRLDRFIRKVRDLTDMIDWSKKHGKGLVSGTESFDLEDPTGQGEMMATMTAMFAQMESKTTSIRVTAAHEALRNSLRWQGGNFPYGYKAIRNPAGPGWALVQDEHATAICREAIGRVIKGESVTAIATDFNRRKILCPQDYQRMLKGVPLRCVCKHEQKDHGPACRKCDCPVYAEYAQEWARSSLQRVLRSEALLGRVMHKGKAVLGRDGMPLVRTEPVIDLQTWNDLQRALQAGSLTRRRTQTPSALLNVVSCACGEPMYKWQKPNRWGTVFQYYKCRLNYKLKTDPARCNERPIPCETLDGLVHRELIRDLGDREVGHIDIIQGDGHEKELAAVAAQLVALDKERFEQRVRRPDYRELKAKLEAEYDRLDALEPDPDEEKWISDQVLFRDKWEHMGTMDKRLWLLDAGVKVTAIRGLMPKIELFDPETGARRSLSVVNDGDVWAVIYLGNLKEILHKVTGGAPE